MIQTSHKTSWYTSESYKSTFEKIPALSCFCSIIHNHQNMKVKVKMLITESLPTLWDPMNWSPPSSSVHVISQARILEWVTISFSRGSYPPRDRTRVSTKLWEQPKCPSIDEQLKDICKYHSAIKLRQAWDLWYVNRSWSHYAKWNNTVICGIQKSWTQKRRGEWWLLGSEGWELGR